MNENNLKTKKLINFGPSGRAVAQPIDTILLDNIFEHLTMERYANVQYFSNTLSNLFHRDKKYMNYQFF